MARPYRVLLGGTSDSEIGIGCPCSEGEAASGDKFLETRLVLNIHRLRSIGFLSSTTRKYCHRCCLCSSRIRCYSARRYSLFEARGAEYPNNVW